jgi:hypothetical protein
LPATWPYLGVAATQGGQHGDGEQLAFGQIDSGAGRR